MKLPGAHSTHLTYCLNVHPAETWEETHRAIADHAVAVRQAVSPGEAPFGLGLRLSARAAAELGREDRLAAFADWLRARNLYAFTVNGFPFGSFHGGRVKERVYAPDWRTPERLTYTCLLADQLARLLPDAVVGSISTVPISYAAWLQSEADHTEACSRLAEAALHLHYVREETGRDICLALEPEPDCVLDAISPAVSYFTDRLWPRACAHLVASAGLTASEADGVVRRHLGLCLDACHVAVGFEDLAGAIRLCATAGIRIAKLQVSAALVCPPGTDAPRALARFADAVYLHQTRVRRADGHVVSYPDLDQAVTHDSQTSCDEWRIHYHVPLYFEGDGVLTSTARELTPGVWAAARAAAIPHWEIETYTFDVLPPDLRARGVVASTVEEYRWLLSRL